MDFDADLYNESNHFQYKDANELINKIIDQNIDKKFEIVMDIGCGTGNVTTMLNSLLSIKQLYAIDVDENMIKFAQKNHPKDNIQYLLQDLGVEWDQIRPELKALEGKVSLMFSNHVLHWIHDKENAVKNLYRLLSKSGKIYANIYFISDLFSDLIGKEKEIHEKEIIRIPPKEEQLNIWINNFKTVGFHIESEFQSKKSTFEEQGFMKALLPLGVLLRKQFFIEKNELKRNEVMSKLKNEIHAKILAKTSKFTDQSTGKAMLEFPYGFWRFILQKSSK